MNANHAIDREKSYDSRAQWTHDAKTFSRTSAKRIITYGIMQQIHRADAREMAEEAVGHALTYRADWA